MSRILCAYGLLLAGGCGEGVIDVGPAGPDDRSPKELLAQYPVDTVLIDVADGSVFEEALIIEGCDKWSAEGIGCRIVDDPDIADIAFRADPSECVPDEEGIVVFGYALWDIHEVVLYTDCIRYAALGGYDIAELERSIFVMVVAHEVGHHLGIWVHVPPTCDGVHLETEDGVPICGPAVMNPGINARLRASGITAYDSLAFDRRDRYLTVIGRPGQVQEKSAHGHENGGCMLRSDRL